MALLRTQSWAIFWLDVPTSCPLCSAIHPTSTVSRRKFLSFFSMTVLNATPLDVSQRIERKLAEYNASNNAFKRWSFEFLSWCLSLFCMVGVVVIYVYLKDEPISAPNSGTFLNLANVLGKVASAALIVPTSEAIGQLKWHWFNDPQAMWDFEIFDKASRGPWGAVMLLFRTKGRSLAALGALLIVLLLAIDTFFQQVIDMPERWSTELAGSSIPRAIWYEPGVGKEFREDIPIATNDPDLYHIVEKFSYGNGTQPISIGNGTQAEIPLVSGVLWFFRPLTLKVSLKGTSPVCALLTCTPRHARLAGVRGQYTRHSVFAIYVQTSPVISHTHA